MASMWLYRVARAWIYVGNAVGSAFVLGTAALYAFALSEPEVRFNVLRLDAKILQYFRPVIVISYAVAVGHCILAIQTVHHHVEKHWRSNRITATERSHGKRELTPSVIVPTQSPTPPKAKNQLCIRMCVRCIPCAASIRKQWVRSQAEITRLFMIWEVANQTYQANKMSQLVASVWINRLVSLVIVLNCWFSPVLHHAMRGQRRVHTRLARLLLDSWLDFVYNIGIPLVIFYPYYRDYTDPFNVFPMLFYYSDTWYVNALSELRQIFVISWIDLVSKTTGAVALLYRLYVVENVLKDAQNPHLMSQRATDHDLRRSTNDSTILRLASEIQSRMTKVLDLVLLVWGLVVLCLHISSTIIAIKGNSLGCLLETRPWGSSSYSCIVLEVSCKARDMPGDITGIIDALDNVDPLKLRVLIISHCEQLHMPSKIQDCAALTMFKVYNTTIRTWDESAAFRDVTNPALQVMYFARVNMSEVPPGLLALDFPSGVWDVEFCHTNLTTLPDVVTVAWQNVAYLVVEASPFIFEFPDVILELSSLQHVLLGMNSIRSIPDAVFTEMELVSLYVDGNPLDQLPATIKTSDKTRSLSIQRTNIHSLPSSWFTVKPQPSLELITTPAYGTPLCEEVAVNDTVIGPFNISCGDERVPLITFPIDDEDKWRAASV